MKIFHTGDVHFQNSPLLGEIKKCAVKIVETAQKEKPDLVVIAGDLFDHGVQLGSPASIEAVRFVQALGDISPVIIIRGTTTHDTEKAVMVMKEVKTKNPIYSTEIVEQIGLYGDGFAPINANDGLGANGLLAVISCFPTVSKACIASVLNPEDMSCLGNEGSKLIADVLEYLGRKNESFVSKGIPTVFVGHGTVNGAIASTGQTMNGHDLEWTVGDLRLAGCSLYCLGHIHRAQAWGNIFYCGSITRLNYGEEEEKGFYIHNIESNTVKSTFIPTPARKIKTKRAEGLPTEDLLADVTEGDCVRIVYEINEEDLSRINEDILKKVALERGAAEVRIEKTIVPKVRVRAEGISSVHSSEEKLKRWAELTGVEITPTVIEKLQMLETLEVI